MKILEYNVRFLTPAFLGDAEQNGRWRTPPFKALLRQWWRVVYAADHKFNVNIQDMRRQEGLLFGNAWLKDEHDKAENTKSLVRLRLERWEEGKETRSVWGNKDVDQPTRDRNAKSVKVLHPEVNKPIGPLLYLGYGPLETKKVMVGREEQWATVLKKNAAIQAGESAKLSLAIATRHPIAEIQGCLEANSSRVERALELISLYGTVGGRSRNGWGSFLLEPAMNQGSGATSLVPPKRSWTDALELDWPHAIGAGQDERPLIWRTKSSFDNWRDVMRVLAIVKIGLRAQFVFPNTSPPHETIQPRHWLSYPITRHGTSQWKPTMRRKPTPRLPNSLRFKVRPAEDDPKKLVGVIFHMPCSPPKGFSPDRRAIEETWKAVHTLLDELTKANSSQRAYASITDARRKAALKQSLDQVELVRIGR